MNSRKGKRPAVGDVTLRTAAFKVFRFKNLRYWLYMPEILRKKLKGSQFTRFFASPSVTPGHTFGIEIMGSPNLVLMLVSKFLRRSRSKLAWDEIRSYQKGWQHVSRSLEVPRVHRIIESKQNSLMWWNWLSISNVELKATCFLDPDILCFSKRQSLATSCAFAAMMRPKRYTIGIE